MFEEHQIEGCLWMENREASSDLGGMLCDEMGMGKTRLILGHIYGGNKGRRELQLVCVPAKTLIQWREEAELVRVYSGSSLTSPLIYTTGLSASVVLSFNIILVSHEVLAKMPELLMRCQYLRIIVDEAHSMRNQKTKLFKSLNQLVARFRWVASGTPIHNRVVDLSAYIRFLRIPDYATYKCKFCPSICPSNAPPVGIYCRICHCSRSKHIMELDLLISNLHDVNERLRQNAEATLQALLSRIMLRRTKEGTLNMSPPEMRTVFLNMSSEEKAAYLDLERFHNELIMTADPGMSLPRLWVKLTRLRMHLSTTSVDTQCSSCLHFYRTGDDVLEGQCGHSIHFNPSVCGRFDTRAIGIPICPFCGENFSTLVRRKYLSNTKLEKILRTILEYRGKVLVFSNFRAPLGILEHRLREVGARSEVITADVLPATRNRFQAEFNDPNSSLRILLSTLKAGGEGLNLGGASLVIIVDPWWNPQAELQAMHRAHRMNLPHRVLCIRFLYHGTIEERIHMLQEYKLSLARNFIGSVADSSGPPDTQYVMGALPIP